QYGVQSGAQYGQPPLTPQYGQVQPSPQYGYSSPQSAQFGTAQTLYAPNQHFQNASSSSSRNRGPSEMAALYVTSVAYGFGMGIWISTELKLQNDPAPFLIAPFVLGVAAPIGAFALDHPSMRRGTPSAITAGLLLGAGEGLGIWGTQAVRADADRAWKFRGLARASAIGSTIGGIAGWAAGEFLEPPPVTSWLAVSGAFWGTAIGSMFTYGGTRGSAKWGEANDKTSIGGLVGYNVGMLAAGGLGALTLPSERQVAWMWGGAGIGAAVSLPVFLFYVGDGGPPARRGFIFTGTATTLGIIAGGIFASDAIRVGQSQRKPNVAMYRPRAFAEVGGVLPVFASDHLGVSIWGSLE
ncbi:MAG TPA: hypothetical protein VIV60_07475, partial [Polyangiaceae bacterium]